MSDDIKKTGGKKRYYIIVPLVLVVLFLGVSAVLFQTGTGRSFLKDQIKTALKSSIDGDLEFEITGGSILGSIVLTDVSLWTKERDFVAAAPEIRASYDLIGILGGRIVVYAIQAEELVFAIENKNGKSTLSGLFLTKENPEPGSNLQIDLTNIVLKKSFFVNFTTSKDKRLFPFSKKIEAATLREMQSKAKGPGKLEGGVGATIVGDIDTAIKVNIDTNGGTNIGIAQLNSKLSIDSFLKVQDLDVSRIALSFFDGNMNLTTGWTKVGKKASTKGLRFQGHFPEKKTEEWFDTHKLEIENLILSRGYLRVLSEFQLNPQLDPSIEFQSRGSLPNRIQYATKIRVANSQIESTGEVAHLLDDAPIRIDSVIDLPFIQASDLLPIDTKIQGRVKLKIDGEFTKPATLNVKGLLTDVDVLDYRFEEAFFAMTLSKGILDIGQFNLTWGDIVGDLSGQIADKGPFDLKFFGDANPKESKDKTSAAIKMAASGTIDWDAQDAKNLLQTLDTNGEWTLGQFAKGPLKVKQSKGEFDIGLANPTTCKAPTKSCYPKNLDVKILSSGRGLRLKNDYVSQYYLDVDMKSKLTKEVDLETVLSALSGNFNVVVSSAKIGATRMDNTKAEGSIRATGTDRFSYQVDLRSKRLSVDGREVKNL